MTTRSLPRIRCGVATLAFVLILSAVLSHIGQDQAFGQKPDRDNQVELPGKDVVASLFKAKAFLGKDGQTLRYRILSPLSDDEVNADEQNADEQNVDEQNADDKAKKYPLVLFLHGAGERGDDNTRQLIHAAADFARPDRRRQFPAYVVFPQCPTDQQWVDVPWEGDTGKGTFSETPSQSMGLTLGLLKTLRQELADVDPSRIYVTGLSMGGYGTWYASAIKSDLFAAAAPICGGGDPEQAKRYRGIPIWAFHGGGDTVVPPSRSREMIAALADSGHAPELRYVEYPGVGHNSWTQTYRSDEFFRWLFSQRKQ